VALSRLVALLTAMTLCGGTFTAPALALPPAEGSGALVGVITGEHGGNVRLVYRTLPEIVEKGGGWEATRPGPSRAVRLEGGARFSIPVPGCPAAERALGCAGTTYEAWATFNGHPCSQTSLAINVTSGEANEVAFLNTQTNPARPEPLRCHAVASHKTAEHETKR